MKSQQTVKNAINGDKEAFCALYDEYKQKLYRYALYKLKNPQDAEDAVSDAVVSSYRQIGTLKNPGAFDAWIFRILNCACTKYIDQQAKSRQTQTIDQWAVENKMYTDFNPQTQELMEALDSLDSQEQSIVLLSVIAGLNSKEIAGLTGLTPGGVRSKLSRSLNKMKNYWSDAE